MSIRAKANNLAKRQGIAPQGGRASSRAAAAEDGRLPGHKMLNQF